VTRWDVNGGAKQVSEGVVGGLCVGDFREVGLVVGPPPQTNLVGLIPIAGRSPPGIEYRITLVLREGRHGWSLIRRRRENQGDF